MKKFYCLTAVLPLITALPVTAQNYQSSYGGSRVINQSSNGLAQPSASYIGPGTMSKSAQGYNTQSTAPNPGLPAVNMGANIRTPGDNLYRPKPPNNYYYQSPQRQRPVNTPQQYYYQPGQNNQPQGGGSTTNSGTATYAEQGYGNNHASRY